MTQANQSSQNHLSLKTRMLIGAAAGLAVISSFLISSGGGLPEWGRFWMIQPLFFGPFAGAMAGLCNFYIVHYRWVIGMNKAVAIALSILVSIVGMWMGIVLGLNGTMWN